MYPCYRFILHYYSVEFVAKHRWKRTSSYVFMIVAIAFILNHAPIFSIPIGDHTMPIKQFFSLFSILALYKQICIKVRFGINKWMYLQIKKKLNKNHIHICSETINFLLLFIWLTYVWCLFIYLLVFVLCPSNL